MSLQVNLVLFDVMNFLLSIQYAIDQCLLTQEKDETTLGALSFTLKNRINFKR